ncbi:MAG: hypothetical protein AMS15_05115 [Planctomycetes bacterium DG_23]|nr:MAG: hypothetical protein AMS15_05115 [Planctomycetes bacterium DG_23]
MKKHTKGTAHPKGEFALIEWIRKNTPLKVRKFPIGIGDDAAAVRVVSGELIVLTTDIILEGTHFRLPEATPYHIGWKAICSALSDVAAMGLRATAAVVSLALREDLSMGFAKRLYRGMAKASSEFDVAIIGGDIGSWDGPIAVAVTVLGETGGLRPIRRSGARPGDWLMVTGTLGGSSWGKHLRFRPRLNEGFILNKTYRIHAMIDISDGLLADLGHILAESEVGAILSAERIPISSAARRGRARPLGASAAPRFSLKSGKSALHHALYDGEDFELLFSASPRESQKILTQKPLGRLRLSHIGEVCKKKGLFILYPHGNKRRVEPVGYEHFRTKKSS